VTAKPTGQESRSTRDGDLTNLTTMDISIPRVATLATDDVR
jgi:hypothetical protein